jgi:hypothetical protein
MQLPNRVRNLLGFGNRRAVAGKGRGADIVRFSVYGGRPKGYSGRVLMGLMQSYYLFG